MKIPATPKPLIEIKTETVPATTHLRNSDQIIEPASKGLSKDIPVKSKPKQAPRGSTTRTPKPTPAVLTDADEITAVTARSKPILIQFDPHTKPRSRAPIRQVVPQPSNDIPFSLTLLGQQRLATPEPAHTFLAEYSVPDRSISFRTAAVGVGLAAAIALFLFSGGAWNRLATLASADRPEIEPQSQQSIVVDKPQVPITKPEKKPARSFENPEPRPLQSITEVSKPDPAKDRSPSASAKPQPVTNKETPEATKPTRDKTVKARVNDIEKRSVEKKQPLPQRKTDGSTRPRIVKISSS